jgi:hypothetical protein
MIIDNLIPMENIEKHISDLMKLNNFIRENDAKLVNDENEKIWIIYGENKKPYFDFFYEMFEKDSK